MRSFVIGELADPPRLDTTVSGFVPGSGTPVRMTVGTPACSVMGMHAAGRGVTLQDVGGFAASGSMLRPRQLVK